MPNLRLVNSRKECLLTCLDLRIIQCMSTRLKRADSRYVLERHLKREEVIQPKREIGRFRGEPVYRRQNVLSCKTAENWMRIGRKVKDRQEPMKWVKQRAVTIQKRRAQELAMQESGESIQQGLYAQHQTEIYTPPPIVDGQIPTNSFGNIDLYAPTMLPAGAVHLACTSFLLQSGQD
jgi:xeroderma pigmentosum group C-complementing protein